MDGMRVKYRAWMPGCTTPVPYEELREPCEKMLVGLIFRQMLKIFVDTNGEMPKCNLRQMFFKQARYDACATVRGEGVTRTRFSLELWFGDIERAM